MMGLFSELEHLQEKIAAYRMEIDLLRRTVAEQRGTIKQYTDVCERYKELYYEADKELAEQSELIEKLGASLQWSWQNLYSLADPAKVIETEEALAAFEQYRNGVK